MAGKCNYQADEFPFLVEADVSLALLSEDVQHFTEVLGLGRKFFCNIKHKKKKKKKKKKKRSIKRDETTIVIILKFFDEEKNGACFLAARGRRAKEMEEARIM